MRGYIALVGSFLLWLVHGLSYGQTIQGQIIDVSDGRPINDAAILNIFTDNGVLSDNQGRFSLPAGKGQLIEFKKTGYKIIRMRLPQGTLPAFFKVVMEKNSVELDAFEVTGASKDYKTDSARYHQLYKEAIDYPQLTGLDMVRHPFSALSKHNQQVWAFQKEYEWYQQQKYIDFTFNIKVVTAVTGLKGDSAQAYIQMFRPTYAQLRSMNEYMYYNYIKRTVTAYRERGIRAKSPPSRSTR